MSRPAFDPETLSLTALSWHMRRPRRGAASSVISALLFCDELDDAGRELAQQWEQRGVLQMVNDKPGMDNYAYFLHPDPPQVERDRPFYLVRDIALAPEPLKSVLQTRRESVVLEMLDKVKELPWVLAPKSVRQQSWPRPHLRHDPYELAPLQQHLVRASNLTNDERAVANLAFNCGYFYTQETRGNQFCLCSDRLLEETIRTHVRQTRNEPRR